MDKLRSIQQKYSSNQYGELSLLSKRKARAILKVGNETLNRLINNGEIKIILIKGKEKIPYVSLQEFVYNMQSKAEQEVKEYEFIEEEEANAIATKILEEINKGGN
jgi:hypothetical protein